MQALHDSLTLHAHHVKKYYFLWIPMMAGFKPKLTLYIKYLIIHFWQLIHLSNWDCKILDFSTYKTLKSYLVKGWQGGLINIISKDNLLNSSNVMP